MLKTLLTLIFGMYFLSGHAQEQFILSFDEFQVVEDQQTLLNSQIRLPRKDIVITLSALNNLSGLGNYLDAFGTKLLVEHMQETANGGHSIILRREDGRDFYDLFPTLNAKLIPMNRQGTSEVFEP